MKKSHVFLFLIIVLATTIISCRNKADDPIPAANYVNNSPKVCAITNHNATDSNITSTKVDTVNNLLTKSNAAVNNNTGDINTLALGDPNKTSDLGNAGSVYLSYSKVDPIDKFLGKYTLGDGSIVFIEKENANLGYINSFHNNGSIPIFIGNDKYQVTFGTNGFVFTPTGTRILIDISSSYIDILPSGANLYIRSMINGVWVSEVGIR